MALSRAFTARDIFADKMEFSLLSTDPLKPPLLGRWHGDSRDGGVKKWKLLTILNPSVSYADSSPKGEPLAGAIFEVVR